ncbi:unannotated protein [freshwater metagenome]|uniref:Unannotated protein n=1 Tax=freshwater metagenome TaxID=449393 RepID=A0A6J7KFD1_9ZZZZ
MDALALDLAEHVDERQLDVAQQVGQAGLVQQPALVDGQQRDAPGGGGGDVRDPLGDGDPGLVGELVERVAAALGLEDVLREQGVVLEPRGAVAADAALGVLGPRGAALGQRLAVVDHERPALEGHEDVGRGGAPADEELLRARVVQQRDGEAQRERRAGSRVALRGRVPRGVGVEELAGLLLLGGDGLDDGDGHGGGVAVRGVRGGERGGEVLQRHHADRGVDRRGVRPGALRGGRAAVRVQERLEAAPRVAQLEAHERLAQRGGVGLGDEERVEVVVDLDVGVDPRQLA